MKYKYPNLCKPIKVGNVTFRNRMFSAPMGGTDITNDGCIGPKSTAFYELRARGGAGAVTVSECMVHPKTDGSHAYHLDTTILNSLAAATYTADAIRRHGAIPSLELSHSGMYAGTYMTDKNRQHSMNQWGPSDTVRPDGVQVKALTKELIDEIVEAYGNVAGLAKRAGFEMLMIHGGHGWLINQFLSPYFNKRTDEYGGSLENRCRFAIEVLKSVRKAVGPGLPIEFRLSGSELFEEGYDLEEGCRIAQQIEPYIDLLHVSAGTYQRGFGDTHPSMFKEHGCNVYLAAEIKKHVKVPVATLGGLNSPEQMEEIIASGKADVVYMARALLADPFLPRKVMANQDDEIVHCLRCFTCMAERAATSTRRCTVNPLIGREMEGVEVRQYSSRTNAAMDLAAGRVDAVMIDSAPAASIVSNIEGLVILEGIEMDEESYSIAFAKDNTELCEQVNAILEKLIEDGTVEELYLKYTLGDGTEEEAAAEETAEEATEAADDAAAEETTEESTEE